MGALITSIITSVLKIVENITTWLCNKTKNTELIDNEKAKKEQQLKDEINKAIKEAHKTKDLDEIRKMSSE